MALQSQASVPSRTGTPRSAGCDGQARALVSGPRTRCEDPEPRAGREVILDRALHGARRRVRVERGSRGLATQMEAEGGVASRSERSPACNRLSHARAQRALVGEVAAVDFDQHVVGYPEDRREAACRRATRSSPTSTSRTVRRPRPPPPCKERAGDVRRPAPDTSSDTDSSASHAPGPRSLRRVLFDVRHPSMSYAHSPRISLRRIRRTETQNAISVKTASHTPCTHIEDPVRSTSTPA